MPEEPFTRKLSRFSGEPSDEELRAFVASTLSSLSSHLRGPDVVDDLILRNRKIWVLLYRASSSAAATAATQPTDPPTSVAVRSQPRP